MAETMRVRGQPAERTVAERLVDDALAQDMGIDLQLRRVVDVSAGSRAGGDAVDVELDDDDIIEFRDADGWVDFRRAGDVADRWAPRRGGPGEPIDLVDALARTDATRGGTDLTTVAAYAARIPDEIRRQVDLIDSLVGKVVDIAADPVARRAAGTVVEWLERTVPDDQIGPERYGRPKSFGVYRLDVDLRLTADGRLDEGATIPPGRSLVLLHGTFSSTEGGFSPLANTTEWARILDHYDGAVYALEHPTLSVNPVQNALDLAVRLPEDATIDVVSHSRGGLVGEFLSLGGSGALDSSLYVRGDPEIQSSERALIETLRTTLVDRNIHVGGFVRVAAPVRGTILASPRVDRVAKILLNVVPSASGPLGWTLVVLKSLMLAFLGQRTDPRVIPGIEAMMPDSPLVRLVNLERSQADPLSDHLGVVAGDVDRSRWLRWFKEKAADLFYGEEHDYVVDTLSMYQGRTRSHAGASLHQGADVNHFTYFSQADSRQRLVSWLTADPDAADLPSGFTPLRRDPPELVKAARKHRGGRERPDVVVVPDLFGTGIEVGELLAWPDPGMLAIEGVATLFAPDAGKATGLLGSTYDPLVERLATEFDVTPLPWDWRRPLSEASDALEETVGTLTAPVHVVGHGTGGLVIRDALRTHTQLSESIGRIVLLGVPHLGSHALLRLLAGQGSLIEALTLLDPTADRADVAAALRALPVFLEVLPSGADGDRDHPDTATLDLAQLAWTPEERARIAGFNDHDWPTPRPIALVGIGHPTPSEVEVRDSGLVFRGRSDGDGLVTAASATFGSATAYHVEASHGELPTVELALDACVDILRDGRTDRLSTRPPPLDDEVADLPDGRHRQLYPTALDLEHAALATARRPASADVGTIAIEVVHGDLRFASDAVLVGHYAGSTLAGAERALDDRLGGRLSRRDVLNVYPGNLGTATFIPGDPDGRPEAAIVVGLGELGLLTSSRVVSAVTEGAVRLAMAALDAAAGSASDRPERLGVSAVLIGSSSSSNLSIDQSVAAITTGVASANRRLAEVGDDPSVRFDRLQIVELYEEVAIEILHAARRLVARSPESLIASQRVAAAHRLSYVEGGEPGQPPPEYDAGSWNPIMIEGSGAPQRRGSRPVPDGRMGGDNRQDLAFTSSGLAARADQSVHASQRDLVDGIIAGVVTESRPDPQIYHTLYQLLLPNYLKGTAADADNLLLTVDSESSRYPWEMLATQDLSGEIKPLSIRSGMIRRLLSPGRPDRRRAVGRRALVIGDPDASPNPKYPPLPGAAKEARLVADVLEGNGYEVRRRIRGARAFRAVDVVNDLFADEYTILHVAAHGTLEDESEQSGIVIGPSSVLSGLTLRQMPAVPPLVFLNCCHLAAMDRDAGRFAATIAEQLIQDGVRAVVAAGWAVDDEAARTFAAAFYQAMFAGLSFGEATRDARRQVHEQHDTTNTWGAYQCYGDPGFRLVGRGDANAERPEFVAPSELERRLRAISKRGVPAAQVAATEAELDELCEDLTGDWATGSLLAAAGEAYKACGNFDKAIDCLSRALQDIRSRAPIAVGEQLANLEGRRAVELVRPVNDRWGPVVPNATATELIQRAEQRLDALKQLNATPTPELLRLRAAHHRRGAYVRQADRAATATSLREAHNDYNAARQAEHGVTSPDHVINSGVMAVLVAALDGRELDDDERLRLLADIHAAQEEAERRFRSNPQFWNRVAGPDGELLRGLVREDLAERTDAIVEGYTTAFTLRSSANNRTSISAHVEFVARMLSLADRSDLAETCRDIHRRLQTAEDGT